MRRKPLIAIGVIAAAFTIVAVIVFPYWTAAALVMRAAGTSGWGGTLARLSGQSVSERVERLETRTGALRVRIFRPPTDTGRWTLLVAGVHRDGIEEPRLIALARELAATGITVVTPEIDDLIHYRLTPRVTDTIEHAAAAIVEGAEKGTGTFSADAPRKRFPSPFPRSVGLIGVSFSGGLSIVAAGRPALRDRLAYVMSFGGHGNLPRVLRYLCTGLEPSATGAPRRRMPHDYATAVVLHQASDLAVPTAQVVGLRRNIELFLEASAVSRASPTAAKPLFEAARAGEAALPEPSRTLMRLVNDRQVAELGRVMQPYLDRLGQDPSLSPDRAPAPSAPVYLLHGVDDNVIPAVESELLFEHLRTQTPTRLLLSRYLTHVDLSARPTLGDTWNMIAFWKAALSE